MRPPSGLTLATVRAAPACRVSVLGSRGAEPGSAGVAAARVSRTSMTSVSVHRPGSTSAMPRPSRSWLIPRRLSAARAGPVSASAGSPRVWMPRTRTGRMEGVITSSSPRRTVPAGSVPVTTVPLPITLNARSTQIRTGAPASGTGRPAASRSSAPTSAGRPSPVAALTATASTSPRLDAAISRPAWASAGPGSARSARVTASRPCRMPRASITARCSADCGIQPSSAATTNSTAGTGPTPASMFVTNRSCPGTSTKASRSPDGRVSQA